MCFEVFLAAEQDETNGKKTHQYVTLSSEELRSKLRRRQYKWKGMDGILRENTI